MPQIRGPAACAPVIAAGANAVALIASANDKASRRIAKTLSPIAEANTHFEEYSIRTALVFYDIAGRTSARASLQFRRSVQRLEAHAGPTLTHASRAFIDETSSNRQDKFGRQSCRFSSHHGLGLRICPHNDAAALA